MNKRVIAAVAAGVLALLGVLVLVKYAQGANDRAFEGAKLVSVVRLTQDVPAGTSSAELAKSTEVVKLPDESVPDGAVTSLDQVVSLATNASVQKGEVLLKSRMSAPGQPAKGSTEVPKGFQEMSFSVETQRALSGAVKPGDRIGVIGSFDVGTVLTKQTTDMVLSNVLVTKVDSGAVKDDITAVSITVAVSTVDAEKLAHTLEFGRTWLTLQNADTDQSGAKPLTVEGVLQ